MGLNEDLDEATRLAVREMVDFLVAEKKLSRDEAYMLCSLAADLHVTQAVDATKGHATSPSHLQMRRYGDGGRGARVLGAGAGAGPGGARPAPRHHPPHGPTSPADPLN